ncbi:unnamed protein product [Clonostachys byssicola]|uniref:Uncharacterized protein n=1 Tax=Clonostachys byssicola TaxID=160290 RepID=A0A9N9XW51_9HYPO|nr:unnamed protein product [Clonostachys byssicola]
MAKAFKFWLRELGLDSIIIFQPEAALFNKYMKTSYFEMVIVAVCRSIIIIHLLGLSHFITLGFAVGLSFCSGFLVLRIIQDGRKVPMSSLRVVVQAIDAAIAIPSLRPILREIIPRAQIFININLAHNNSAVSHIRHTVDVSQLTWITIFKSPEHSGMSLLNQLLSY